MKLKHILTFTISLLLAIPGTVNSQETSEPVEEKTDTLKVKENYGFRVGLDISKPIISFFDNENKGLEIVGDFRLSTNLYVAAELGFQDKTKSEDFFNFSTKGSFIKMGVNFNAYENWAGMNNEIFVGFRYGFSSFSQTLNSYTPNNFGMGFIADELQPNTEFSGLSAHWVELVFGFKVETFKNFYLNTSISLKKLISDSELDNFKNLYIPGFNRVYLNDTGVSFNYTLTYLIPLFEKEK